MFLSLRALVLVLSSLALCHAAALDGPSLERRDARPTRTQTNAAAAATILTPEEACVRYHLPEVTKLLDEFPPLWQTATPVSQAAKDLFAAIEPGIPDIAIKGQPPAAGVASTGYNVTEDPDCWWTSPLHCVTPKHAGLPDDLYRCEEPRTLGLTFDDGPNCSHNALYDELNRRNQKVTLFYIGSNIAMWPLEAQRGIVDGHEVCLHSWSHPYLTGLTNEEVWAELYYSLRISQAVMGITPTCFRPPYGDIDDRVRYIANSLGVRVMIWNADTHDYEASLLPSEEMGRAQVLDNYAALEESARNGTFDRSGAVVLSHELRNLTMQLAVEALPGLQDAFEHVMPVGVCANITRPYLEDILSPNFGDYAAGNLLPLGLPAGGFMRIADTLVPEADVGQTIRAFTAAHPPNRTRQADVLLNTVFPTTPYAANGNMTLPPPGPEPPLGSALLRTAIILGTGAGVLLVTLLVVVRILLRNRKPKPSSKTEVAGTAPAAAASATSVAGETDAGSEPYKVHLGDATPMSEASGTLRR